MKKFLFCLLYVLTSTITANAQNGWFKVDYIGNNKVDMLVYENEDKGYYISIDNGGCIIIQSPIKVYFPSRSQTLTLIEYYNINGKRISEYNEIFDKVDDFSIGTIQSKEKQNRVYDYITKQKGFISIFALPADETEGLYFVAPCINN